MNAPQGGAALFAIALVGMVAFVIWMRVRARREMTRRLHLATGDDAKSAEGRIGARLRGGVGGAIGALSQLMPLGEADQEKIRRALRRADVDSDTAYATVVGAKVACVLLGISAGLVVGPLMLEGVVGWIAGLVGGFLAGIILNLMPELIATQLGRRRTRKVSDGLLDAFDLMIIALESGLTFERSLARTITSLRYLWPDLARELRRGSVDMAARGRSRPEALLSIAERLDSDELRDLATVVGQSERHGTPLADALRKLAGSLRITRSSRLQEKAGRLPTLLVLPTIGGMIPGLMVIVAGPAFMELTTSLQGFGG